MQSNVLRCFFGHHKCGTQWIQGILREICKEMGLKYGHAYNSQKFNNNLQESIKEKKIAIFSYTNADYNYVKQLKSDYLAFHVIRDPRDIVVSAYFSHLYSHPTDQYPRLKEERERLEKMSKDEGLLQEIKFNHNVFTQMHEWDYELKNILEIKMENLIQNPYSSFINIFRFLGIISESRPTFLEKWNYLWVTTTSNIQRKIFKEEFLSFQLQTIPYDRVLGIVYENDFQKKTRGRAIGEENVKSHYRKGVAGDWKNHFKQEHIDYFKHNYNDLLIKLGYEVNDHW